MLASVPNVKRIFDYAFIECNLFGRIFYIFSNGFPRWGYETCISTLIYKLYTCAGNKIML